jgi:glycosyltransferase involved in cell wall biosynthesis
MNIPKISVIIPVYNVEQYLRQCLDSLINQQFKDFECICINDCSTDNSYAVLKEYAEKDNRFIIVDLPKNKGQGNARNEGLKIAKGEYVSFVDSDDWVTKDYLEVLYNEIDKNKLDMVCASACFYDDFQEKIINKKFVSAKILNSCNIETLLIPKFNFFIIPVWLKIYRKQFLYDNNMFFRLNWQEDNLFLFETIIKTNKFKFLDDKKYIYRINRKNSSTSEIDKQFTYFLLFEKLKEMLVESNKYEQYKTVYYQYISILTASKLEFLELPLSKLTTYYNEFKKLYYNKDFIDNFSIKKINIMLKIRQVLFYLCLKFNINYIVVGKFCRKINFIKLLKK